MEHYDVDDDGGGDGDGDGDGVGDEMIVAATYFTSLHSSLQGYWIRCRREKANRTVNVWLYGK